MFNFLKPFKDNRIKFSHVIITAVISTILLATGVGFLAFLAALLIIVLYGRYLKSYSVSQLAFTVLWFFIAAVVFVENEGALLAGSFILVALTLLFILKLVLLAIEKYQNNQNKSIKINNEVKKKEATGKKINGEINDSLLDLGLDFKVEIKASYMTDYEQFIEDSILFKDIKVHIKQNFEPFYQYWPTFRSLNKKQLQWYFYWRRQFEKENYLDTDLSYIYLYVYELINLTYEPNWEEAAKKLVKLYHVYSVIQPGLDAHLPRWIADLYWENGQEVMAFEWYGKENSLFGKQIVLTKALEQKDLSIIPLDMWLEIANYKETAHFKEFPTETARTFTTAIELTEEYYQNNKGHSLLLEWSNIHKDALPKNHLLFNSAVIGRELKREGPKYYPINIYQNMPTKLNNLFRYVENLERQKRGNKRLLQVNEKEILKKLRNIFEDNIGTLDRFTIVQGLQDQIEKADGPDLSIPKQPDINEKQFEKIQIDKQKVEELYNESFQLRDLLSEALDKNPKVPSEKASGKEVSMKVKANSLEEGSFEETNEFQPEDMAILPDTFTIAEKQFISLLIEKETLDYGEAKEYFKVRGRMLEPVIERINEKALDIYGELLIEVTEEKVFLIGEISLTSAN